MTFVNIKWFLQQFLSMTSARSIGKRLIAHYRLSAFRSSKRQNRAAVNKLFIFCVMAELEIYICMVLKEDALQQEEIWRHVPLL